MDREKYTKRLIELRRKKRKRKAELARILGVDIEIYNVHEKDGRFSASQLVKLANLYDVSMDYMLGISDERNITIMENVR